MIEFITKAANYVIPTSDLRYSHRDPLSPDQIYFILMPITKIWQEIRIDSRYVKSGVLPSSVCSLIDYYIETKKIMEHARDLQIFNGDIRPISDEEKRLFSVRFWSSWIGSISGEMTASTAYFRKVINETIYV